MASPGSISSLPVEITTIIGWALTRSRAMPAPAAIATSGADRRVPAANNNAPCGQSEPRRCTFCQGSTCLRPISAIAPLRCTCSTGTTASQPRGNMAPVMISMQVSGSARVCGGSPAACTAGDAQAPGVVGRGRGGKRDAVHGHPIERRMVAFGVDVFAQHGARCLGERQGLDRQARQVLLDQSFGLGRRQHGHGFL